MEGTIGSASDELASVACNSVGQGAWALVLVRCMRHSPEAVWSALTDPVLLRRWAPNVPDRNLGSVGPATVTLRAGCRSVDLAARVTRADPGRSLECTWAEDHLLWDLSPVASGTRLTLEHTFLERAWAPEIAAGWHVHLDSAERVLDRHTARAICRTEPPSYRWHELVYDYGELLVRPPSAGRRR
ncbi:MAG TPA: SRPBCC domain-containing protein [Kineosporiaceae bacterium]|nr:SRPBCC domain-containing protein [Kineosporiaceae bacterium]